VDKENSRRTGTGFLVHAAAFVIVVAGMQAATGLIVQILLAAFIAIIATPLFVSLQRKRLPASLSLLIIVLIILGVGLGVVALLGSSLPQLATKIPEYQSLLQGHLSDLFVWLRSHDVEVDEAVAGLLNIQNAMGVATTAVTTASGLLGNALMIFILVAFMLIEAAILPAKVRSLPGMTEETWSQLVVATDSVRHYMGMKTVISGLTGVIVTIVMSLMGVDFPFLLGFVAFLFNYIPTVGSIIASIPGIALALIQFGPGRAVLVGVFYFTLNTVIGNVLEPRVMGRGLGLSPLVIMISMMVWGWVLGPVGMLLSVPLTMAIKIGLECVDSTRGAAVLLSGTAPSEESIRQRGVGSTSPPVDEDSSDTT
jgi:AI-2 transport protein TqsA